MPKKRKRAISGETLRKRMVAAQRTRRSDSQIRAKEQARDSIAHRTRRSDPQIRAEEQERNTAAHRTRRSDPQIRAEEQARDSIAHRTRRSDPQIRAEEQETNTAAHRTRRSDPQIRAEEQARDSIAHRTRRSDPQIRAEEQEANTTVHRTRRSDPLVRAEEQERNTAAHQSKRKEPRFWEHIVAEYNRNVTEGPTFVCYSCDRLFFRKSMRFVVQDILLREKGCSETFLNEVILAQYLDEDIYQFCSTCANCFCGKNKRYPRYNINKSKLAFPEVPQVVKDLTSLEERLVAPRIPFMKIFGLGCDRQFGLRAGVINVPVDIPKMFKTIPIRPEQAEVVHLKLKRKLAYNSHYIFERICPQNVYQAGQILVQTELYMNEGVTLDESWPELNITEFNADVGNEEERNDEINSNLAHDQEMIPEENVQEEVIGEEIFMDYNPLLGLLESELNVEETSYDELENVSTAIRGQGLIDGVPSDIMDVDAAPLETSDDAHEQLLYEETLMDANTVIEFAPGEGQHPLSLLLDTYCEELSFPTIWGGQARTCSPEVKLSYEEHIKSEIMRSDRRAVRPDHLLFVHKKSQLKQLCSNVNIALKKAAQSKNVTASMALDATHLSELISNDNAYRFLTNITGSPAYWEQQKKNLLGMVRQLGGFNIFITLTAAETQWDELLKILKSTVDKEEDADVSNMDFEEKARLIRSDPVTCARYFEHRFKEVMKTWNMSEEGPFKNYKVKQIYYRIEFQHRGSPHLHGAIWLEGAPEFDASQPETFTTVENFIDEIITTDSDDPEVQDFIKFQKHKCTHTCWKKSKGQKVCRFGAPFLPMDRTRILQPLPEGHELKDEEKEQCRSLMEKLAEMLSDDLGAIGTFDDMLEKLNCSIEDYILAIRSQLTSDKIFIRRAPKNARVNNYSKKILTLMRANIDVQFVLNVYGCLGYIVEYINKASRGISRLLRSCVESFSNGNHSIQEKLQSVSNTFYNGTEISAQEAAWCRLQLPMSSSSVVVEFINTGPSEKRHRMLKSAAELKSLPSDSQDIYRKGTLERYIERPAELENLCLADFVALFNFKGKKDTSDEATMDQGDETLRNLIRNDTESIIEKKIYQLVDGTLQRRKQPKVIRFCRFDFHKDPKNFFRERLMLFKPWRNEADELENPTSAELEEIYTQFRDQIEANTQKYIKIDMDLSELISGMENLRAAEETEEGTLENYFPNEALQVNNVFDYDDSILTADVLTELGQENASISTTPAAGEVNRLTVPDQMDKDDFFNLVNSLNEKQQDYLMHILSCFKLGELPLYHFISGEAGVGKSRLIKAIYQTLIRWFRKDGGPAENPEIILVAYTGKAAHNINGITSHNAFSLAMVTSDKISAEALNTLRVKFANLKLIIIDEISMMGKRTFDNINTRLCQVFQTSRPFGGKSLIVLGDFYQLPPILDEYVFSPGKNPVQQMIGNLLWKKFQLFELTEIMRQKDDLPYAEALGRLGKGQTTPEDEEMFQSRCFVDTNDIQGRRAGKPCLPEEASSAARLMWKNADVDAYNLRRLRELRETSSFSYEVPAFDTVVGSYSPAEADQVRYNLEQLDKKGHSKTNGLPKTLIIQEGVRYMITSNIDVSDGLFNGASGICRYVEVSQQRSGEISEEIPTENSAVKYGAVYLEFDDAKVGEKARQCRRQIMLVNPAIKENWTPIKPMALTFQVTRRKINAQARRLQYPMVVAEAITIHKSQGSTLSKVVVHLVKGMVMALIYVAFSRSMLLTGLYIIGNFYKPKPMKDDKPGTEMKRLRETCALVPKFAFFKDIPSDVIQIVSHNVQSIRNHHINTIRNDKVFMKSDLLLLQETWATMDEMFPIEGMAEVIRNGIDGPPTARGTMIYSKRSRPAYAIESNSFENGNQRIDITACEVNDIIFLNVYKNPSTTAEFFEESLMDLQELFYNDNLILCGDFNDRQITKETSRLHTILNSTFQLQLLSPKGALTTDEFTSIDAVFGKLKDYQADVFVYESFSSFHKPLVIRLKKRVSDE